MGSHDEYGKRVLRRATNGEVEQFGGPVEIDYGAGLPARIDGAIGKNIAVEVESRTAKQVRGAVLDLICHPCPKKLLLLLPVHMPDPDVTAKQSENIMCRFLDRDSFRVLVLTGSGDSPKEAADSKLVSGALAELGFQGTAVQTHISERAEMHEVHRTTSMPQPNRAGGKYGKLEKYLRTLPASTKNLSLTFQEVEQILGFSLPASALTYREWWSNQADVSNRPQARAWMNSGFRVKTVRQSGRDSWVKFVHR